MAHPYHPLLLNQKNQLKGVPQVLHKQIFHCIVIVLKLLKKHILLVMMAAEYSVHNEVY